MAGSLEAAVLIGVAGLATLFSMFVVRYRDMVYASASLALVGLASAAILGLLGFPLVAVFLVIVYVGAAVMFIIVSVSMLGGGGREEWDDWRGLAAAAAAFSTVILLGFVGGLWQLYTAPQPVRLDSIALILTRDLYPVIIVLAAGLAATILEGIAIARRR
ncbi:NADH-quinone oxidoreductase subunit J family protein [Aeropyrum camini]|uniref:NuoJ-like protein n=1 Tax=Aeropyrum camini SY1 = JCM 12091 TaxID=1198449 RepID=U3TD57_9CREN|nr:NADH-quinone oxidoreductase subunit J [Aeropyrum camini]BAN90361.1 NuoJ-like protein [Aeropyrum camini SY1 = JCM 12091]